MLPATRKLIGMFLTIRSKILLAFVAIAVITGCLGSYAVHGIRLAGDLVVETFDQSLMSINYARAAATDFAQMQAAFARRRDVTDPAARKALDEQIATAAETLDEDLGIAADRSRSRQASGAADAVRHAAADWTAAEQRDDAAALAAAGAAVDAQIDLLVNFTAGDGFLYRQRALGQIATESRLNIAGTIIALVIAAGITWLLSRRIMGPLAAASAAASRIAWGELDTTIPRGGADELGALLAAMAVMRDNISDMMAREVAQRRSAQSRLLDAIESSNEGVLLVDSEGIVVIVNSTIGSYFRPVADLLKAGTPFAALLAATVERGCFAAPLPNATLLAGWAGDQAPSAVEQQLADGRWLRISRSTTLEGGIVLICSDITASKQHEVALERTNLWFSTTLDTMSQGLVMFDGQDRLQVVNRSFAEIHGLALTELHGLSYGQLLDRNIAAGNFPADRRSALYTERMAAIAQGGSRMLVSELADGRQLTIMHEPMPDGGWVAIYEDVTERRRADAQILFLTHHDALTGLANRVQLADNVDQTLRQRRGQSDAARRFALLCLDLDQFKAVNDTLGHHHGDLLLRAVAERLVRCVGEDNVVARLGGDEFAVLLRAPEGPNAVVVTAQRVLAALRMPYDIEGEQVICGTSIGIALAPDDGDTSEMLLKNADTALYRAKSDGRGIYRFFEAEMDARQQARRSLELDLRRAVENDGFQLFFQPLIETRSERLCGFESLLRWQHPIRGMVSPAEFVPMAEECGLIVPIGAWVLREACRVAATWPDHVKVAVNVSPLQFKSPQLLDAVIEALELSGLPARRLELEITESVLLHDSASVMTTLHQLHNLGLRISMDDFGTGYSSLSYLRSFPFDKIKIDQSFVRDLGSEKDSAAIVRAIIGMGLSLGMRITAEGVETEAQLAMLRAESCTEIQGYYYSRPKPAHEVPALLARWSGAPELLELAS